MAAADGVTGQAGQGGQALDASRATGSEVLSNEAKEEAAGEEVGAEGGKGNSPRFSGQEAKDTAAKVRTEPALLKENLP